jgi:hypothetical protein
MAAVAKLRAQHQHNTAFDESQCGGAFDGFSVSSDADSGL